MSKTNELTFIKTLLYHKPHGDLIVSETDFGKLTELYKQFAEDSSQFSQDFQNEWKNAQLLGRLDCINSPFPSPCVTDANCQKFGLKTAKMLDAKTPATVMAIGNLSIKDNSQIDATDTSIVGGKFTLPDNGALFLGLNGRGFQIPAANSSQFKSFTYFIIIIAIIMVFLLVLGAIVEIVKIHKQHDQYNIST